jgi:hypothetical protein
VDLRRRTIERNRQPSQPAIFQLHNVFARQQWRGARRQREANFVFRSVTHQFEDVGTFQWIASGEHKYRDFHGGDFVEQTFCLTCAQFQRIPAGLRAGPAVYASQVASLRRLPYRHIWPFIKIHTGIAVHAGRLLGGTFSACQTMSLADMTRVTA